MSAVGATRERGRLVGREPEAHEALAAAVVHGVSSAAPRYGAQAFWFHVHWSSKMQNDFAQVL